jgi:deoxyribodipyrimidine photo-lyase
MPFTTDYKAILAAIDNIDPIAYGKTRNFIDGAVTRLSPYISRGVVSTRFIMERTLERGFRPAQIQKFLQELAWRDYFQRVAIANPDLLEKDILQPQPRRQKQGMPVSVNKASTRILGIDQAIRDLYETGYMHNHCRMYTASVICNIGRYGWETPAKWMYYHLLDADFASNACSWQWVAGAFSRKLYFANQENINKYCRTNQRGTFLDVDYTHIEHISAPEILADTESPTFETELPTTAIPQIDPSKPILIYNIYQLDPEWRKDEDANRILLLEPSHFKRLPVCDRTLKFALDLGTNIPGLQVFVGEFDELMRLTNSNNIRFKEHPLFNHYKGLQDDRDWMFPDVTAASGGFFGFWKKCERQLQKGY